MGMFPTLGSGKLAAADPSDWITVQPLTQEERDEITKQRDILRHHIPEKKPDKALDKIREVVAEREGNYADPLEMFQKIADMWNAYIFDGADAEILQPSDVATMMTLFKIARSTNGENSSTADDLLDAVGYSAFASDLRAENH